MAEMFESHIHSFVIKIWLEESAGEAGRAVWRGTITHVPSGKRRHLQTLGDITSFIAPYLKDWGVQLDLCGRIGRWMKQHKL